jgi:hypothetical protein
MVGMHVLSGNMSISVGGEIKKTAGLEDLLKAS